jgi:hypothetical protein
MVSLTTGSIDSGVIVCGPTDGIENEIASVPPVEFALLIASRRLQCVASQTESSTSFELFTTIPSGSESNADVVPLTFVEVAVTFGPVKNPEADQLPDPFATAVAR